MENKKCTKCNDVKLINKFYVRNTRNGHKVDSHCKECNAIQYKKYYEANKERLNKKRKKHHELNKENDKKWREKNKEQIKKYQKEWYAKNKKLKLEYSKEYNKKNKGRTNKRLKERRENEPLFKLTNNLRRRTWGAFKSMDIKKNSRTYEIIGLEWEELKLYIETMFTDGMKWENYGEWHIDHIYPLSRAKSEEHLKELCHYSNLQPLWAEENLSKYNKIL